MHLDRQQPGLDALAQDALGQEAVEHPREQREDVDVQGHWRANDWLKRIKLNCGRKRERSCERERAERTPLACPELVERLTLAATLFVKPL